jgi:glycosyltransferase involved in cell wall biosynthesis
VEVAVATMGEPLRDHQREKAGRVPRLKVFESRFKPEWMDEPWHDVERAGEWLLSLEDRFGPDVVHLHGYVHAALPWRAPKVVVGHSCVLSWWEAVKGEPAPEAWDGYRQAVRAGLAAADLVAAPTVAMLAALDRHYGPLPPGRVIPNGRDARLFPPTAKDPMLFAAGRLWDEAANLTVLEQIAGDLAWPVYVAGETRQNGADDAYALPRRTHPLGPLSQRAIAAWLGRSAIYVLPARYEPFGLAALEAALADCALVLGDIPSLREVWDERAVFVAPGDAGGLAAALAALIGDPERRHELAAAARERALALTPEAMVEAYLESYAELQREESEEAHDAPQRVAV